MYGEDAPRLLSLARLGPIRECRAFKGFEKVILEPKPAAHRSLGPVESLKEPLPPLIRKFTSKESTLVSHISSTKSTRIRNYTSRDEVKYCVDKLREVTQTVQQITHEYRALMNTIMRSNKRPINLAVRRVSNDQSNATKARIRETRGYINKLAIEADAIDAKLYHFQKQFQHILDNATQTVFDHLLIRVQRIIAYISKLRSEFIRILSFISLRTRLTHATNNSAVTIYELHVSLRWCLGDMVFPRQQHQHPQSLAQSVLPLEGRLMKMRAYGTNLFYDREAMSVPYVRQRLLDMEAQDSVARDLKLSRLVEGREKIFTLSLAERIQRNKVVKSKEPRVGMKVQDIPDSSQTGSKSDWKHPIFRRIVVPLIGLHPTTRPFRRHRRSTARQSSGSLPDAYVAPPLRLMNEGRRQRRSVLKSMLEQEKSIGRQFLMEHNRNYMFRKTASSRWTDKIARENLKLHMLSMRAQKSSSRQRFPTETNQNRMFRKIIDRRWKDRIAQEKLRVRTQTTRKAQEKRKLVDSVKGWLGGGGTEEKHGAGGQSEEWVFGRSRRFSQVWEGGGELLSDPSLRDDADLLPEVQRDGGYGGGESHGQQTHIEDVLPNGARGDGFSDVDNKVAASLRGGSLEDTDSQSRKNNQKRDDTKSS
jgi:hypothetical protein